MSSVRNAALFLALGICWGGSFPAIEVGLTELRPLLLGAYRFDVGALVALAYVGWRAEEPVPRSRTDLGAVAVAALLFVVANIAFLAYGQRYTTGGIASIVYSLNPILTTFFTVWILDEGTLDARGYVGVLLGVLGVGHVRVVLLYLLPVCVPDLVLGGVGLDPEHVVVRRGHGGPDCAE